jgi:hypothetical protein
MSSSKQLILLGLMGKTESTYAGGGALSAATDGILMRQAAEAKRTYRVAGARPFQIASAGPGRRVKPGGRIITFPLSQEFRGPQTAYSGSAFLPDGLHTMMLVSGHSATFSAAPTPQWTFAPISGPTWTSLVAEGYSRGQKWPMIGGYADWGFMVDVEQEATYWDFPISAMLSAEATDVAAPNITWYDGSKLPPEPAGVTVTMGLFTAGIVSKITGAKNQNIFPRGAITSAGRLAGFGMGRSRRFEVVVEFEGASLTVADPWSAAGTINPYELQNNSKPQLLEFFVNPGVQYNRWKFSAPQAYCTDVEEIGNEAAAMWRATFECAVSAPGVNDDYTVLVN